MIHAIDLDGKSYEFESSFGFARKLKANGVGCYKSLADVSSIDCEPETLITTLKCSMISVNGSSEFDPVAESEQLINAAGLQRCQELAGDILTAILLGDVKKQELNKESKIRAILNSLNPISLFSDSWKTGLLWVATLVISGLVGAASMMLLLSLTK